MTIQTLSTVTLETIENCRHAAALSVKTYRSGGRRLIHAVQNGLQRNVDSRTRQVAPQLTDTLVQVRGGLADIFVKGLDNVSTGAEKAIELSSETAVKGVRQVARFAAGVDNRVAANGIDAVVRLSMPGAQVVRSLSARVVKGVDKLSHAAAGKPARVAGAAKQTAVRARRVALRKASTVKSAMSRKATVSPRKTVAKTKAVLARGKRKLVKGAAA
jgi:hypothetical protein